MAVLKLEAFETKKHSADPSKRGPRGTMRTWTCESTRHSRTVRLSWVPQPLPHRHKSPTGHTPCWKASHFNRFFFFYQNDMTSKQVDFFLTRVFFFCILKLFIVLYVITIFTCLLFVFQSFCFAFHICCIFSTKKTWTYIYMYKYIFLHLYICTHICFACHQKMNMSYMFYCDDVFEQLLVFLNVYLYIQH